MAHLSEDARRLAVQWRTLTDSAALPEPDAGRPEVWFIVLPFGRTLADAARSGAWLPRLRDFAGRLHPDSILALLTTPEDAAETWPALRKPLYFQLCVSVKLDRPRDLGPGRLPQQHASLLILSRTRGALRHAKTRIAYSYCPACDRTTKDYGGKKHTYHEYGTLLSDVWRDLAWTPDSTPDALADRLSDLFGLEPFRTLNVVSLIGDRALRPARRRRAQIEVDVAPAEPALVSRLVQGDCLEQLRCLPENSVDFCFADPPYNLRKQYDSWDDGLEVAEYFQWCDRWLDELARVLRPGRTCAVLNIPQWAIRHFAHLKRRLTFQNWITWEGLSLPVRRIMPAHYAIVCFSRGAPRPLPGLAASGMGPAREILTSLREFYCLRPGCVQRRHADGIDDRTALTDLWWDVHRLKHNARRVDHPCQLPPALMLRLIALFTAPGELVLDPFDGSGTTSLCAALLGRRHVGIELSATYHALARQRHAILERGGDPFAKDDSVPCVKNSRVRRLGHVEYEVPKKTLQLEVRQIAHALGRLPTRADVERLSRYPIRYFDDYFINWGEVCAAARTTGMSERRRAPTHSEAMQGELFAGPGSGA